MAELLISEKQQKLNEILWFRYLRELRGDGDNY